MKKSKVRIRNKIKKIKKPTHGKVKKAFWHLFATYIKFRDGWVCVQCGVGRDKATIQAGHVIPQATGDSIRYLENNVFAQCAGCNKRHTYVQKPYNDWFKKKYGKEAFERLDEIAGIPKKYSTQDLIDLFHKYENKLLNEFNIDYKEYSRKIYYIRKETSEAFINYYN